MPLMLKYFNLILMEQANHQKLFTIIMFIHLLLQNFKDSEGAYFQYGPPTINEELQRELNDARSRIETRGRDS